MSDARRVALRRSTTPATLLVALLVAVLETATGFAAGVLAVAIDPWFAGLALVRTAIGSFLLPFVLWLPVASVALAGFYSVLDAPPADVRTSLRTFARGGRQHFRRYLVAALTGSLVSLVVLLGVWLALTSGFLAASTAFDYVRYARGARFAANPQYALYLGGILLLLAAVVASTVVAYVGPFVVQTDLPATRLPLASIGFVRRQPREALPTAVAATLLFAFPAHLGRTVLDEMRPDPGWFGPPRAVYDAQLFTAVAAGLAVSTLAAVFARSVAGPLLVGVADRHAAPDGAGPSVRSALSPGRRTRVVVAVLLLVGAGSAAVRVADVHPQNPPDPGIDLDRPPGEVYRQSVALTERTGRRENYTTVTRYPNGTFEQRVTWETAWDPRDHQLVVALDGRRRGEPPGVSTTYFAEGVLARRTTGDFVSGWSRDQFEGLVRAHDGWIVLPLPAYGTTVDADLVGDVGRYHTSETATLRVAERTDDALVLTATGPDAAPLSQFAGADRVAFRNASFRATIDPQTGYLRRLRLDGTRVDLNRTGAVVDRRHVTITATYRDVGATDVERPALGDSGPLELAWDVLYY